MSSGPGIPRSIGRAGVVLFAVLAFAGSASAGPITPMSENFEDLPQATFGGTGIPTDPTAFTVFDGINGDLLTLGLSATQRFSNPALGNDGNGTYFATTGANDGTPGSTAGTVGATWNFNYFIEITNPNGPTTSTIEDYAVRLLYDFDPGKGTDETLHGVIDFNAFAAGTGGFPLGTLQEGSQNLAFGFLAGLPPLPGITTPPAFGSFDPYANGEYTFALTSEAGKVSIKVKVPAPATAPLVLGALGLVALVRRRRQG